MEIKQKLIPIPSKRRSGEKIIAVKYLVAHDSGNDNSTAKQNVDYYIKSADVVEASAHYFVDDLGIIQCIPDEEKAWHVRRSVGIDQKLFGSAANDTAFGVELCYGPAWTPERNLKAYQNYVELIASLCKKYNLIPNSQIVAHATLDPDRRKDPMNAFTWVKKTWSDFISDIAIAMRDTPTTCPAKAPRFTQELRYGSKGPEVQELQKMLRKLNLFDYPTDTGSFFSVTEASVRKFQKMLTLPETGILDEKTRQKANCLVD